MTDPNDTRSGDPLLEALNRVLENRGARPQHVYRLAVIVLALLDSLDDPDARQTIRGELQALIKDIEPTTQ